MNGIGGLERASVIGSIKPVSGGLEGKGHSRIGLGKQLSTNGDIFVDKTNHMVGINSYRDQCNCDCACGM